MRQALLLFMLVPLLAWTQPVKLPRSYSCELPPPDSVDVTGDGVADFVVRGLLGVATCDIPVSHGGCEVVVLALPGTQLLAHRHPMGGHDVLGFAKGDTIPAVDTGVQDDLRIPRYAFVDGAAPALHWSYGRNGTAPPRLARGGERVFVFATTVGE
ncbi:MAG TPA: hypothetical protein PKY96_07865, partial [Flavobacteriales bacterium]|nr:hypothetical protein [Flavobacteriales bacterium]